jgi:hypothetical protein
MMDVRSVWLNFIEQIYQNYEELSRIVMDSLDFQPMLVIHLTRVFVRSCQPATSMVRWCRWSSILQFASLMCMAEGREVVMMVLEVGGDSDPI